MSITGGSHHELSGDWHSVGTYSVNILFKFNILTLTLMDLDEWVAWWVLKAFVCDSRIYTGSIPDVCVIFISRVGVSWEEEDYENLDKYVYRY